MTDTTEAMRSAFTDIMREHYRAGNEYKVCLRADGEYYDRFDQGAWMMFRKMQSLASREVGWQKVPVTGTMVICSHPQTVINPDHQFEIIEVKQSSGRWYARGEKNAFFSVDMLSPAAPADLENT